MVLIFISQARGKLFGISLSCRYKTPMEAVREQYERWPYPRIPLLARVHREQLWQLELSWLAARCGRGVPSAQPRIWIAGCGTFQPYVFARANPRAKILATDLSQKSLDLASKRCHWHGLRQVEFFRLDLEDERSLPAGPFDMIECYGVLMSLADPQAALRRMAERLAPHGVLRLMVYPHYSRRRIFQIQRLARLLGLGHRERQHPGLLRAVMRALPEAHPLRATFFAYPDSQNEEGIVDGFLHASDRGFTALEVFRLAWAAGLAPAFYFHRPWGQPEAMAKPLGLEGQHPALVLHYLDLWQELRSNFTICFVKAQGSSPLTQKAKHPLWDLSNESTGLRHRLRLARLAFTGASVESRTHESPLTLSGPAVRALLHGRRDRLPLEAQEILPSFDSAALSPPLPEALTGIVPEPFFALHREANSPNPLYAHLFEAWTFDRKANPMLSRAIPPLSEQIEKWRSQASPLEDKSCPFGLTPWASYESRSQQARAGIESLSRSSEKSDFERMRLPSEEEAFRQVDRLLSRFSGLPTSPLSPAGKRELWVFLFSFPDLLFGGQTNRGRIE